MKLEREKELVTQMCPTLCNPMDCSLAGSSALGISQAGILEWVAISEGNVKWNFNFTLGFYGLPWWLRW